MPALVAIDVDYLREHPETPPLYRSGVRYEAEPPGQEQWLSIPHILIRRDAGKGSDCEDLAAWRAAELIVRAGEKARCIWSDRVVQAPSGPTRVYHIRVKRASGRIEDPSAMLGMGREMAAAWGENHFITDGERT